MCRTMGRVMPQHSNNRNEPTNMEDDDEDLELRQRVGYNHVDEDGDGDDQPREERALPLFCVVIGVVENEQALEDGAGEDGFGGRAEGRADGGAKDARPGDVDAAGGAAG